LRKARPQFIHGRQVIEIGRTQSTQLRTFTVSAGGVESAAGFFRPQYLQIRFARSFK
jgi:hypothetical protein